MGLKLIYLVVTRCVITLAVAQRRDPSLAHKLTWADRAWLVLLAGLLPHGHHSRVRLIVTPGTVLRWDHHLRPRLRRGRGAVPGAPHRAAPWNTDELRDSLLALHQAGWAHSVEVWDGGELIGGVFGTGMGTIFSAESTFHRRPGAGKVAIADLGRRLARTRPEAPIDVQVPSDYSTNLGAAPLSRTEFLATVADVDLPLVPATGVFARRPVWGWGRG